jgi:hypothetical protein
MYGFPYTMIIKLEGNWKVKLNNKSMKVFHATITPVTDY